MFIDTNTPDLQNFDPTVQGLPLPPVGLYSNVTFFVTDSEQGITKTGNGKLDVTFQAQDGAIAGHSFKMTYNTGHSNPDTAKWAVQDLLRIISAITGDTQFPRGTQFDNKLFMRPFIATLEVTNQMNKQSGQPILDDNGTPFRNGKLKSFVFPNKNTQQVGQPQRAQEPVGQPQTAQNTPSWHNR